jgi:hypothetical protein
MDVSKQWCREFYRLREKVFFNTKEVNDIDNYQFNILNEKEHVENSLTGFSPKEYIFLKEKEKVNKSNPSSTKKHMIRKNQF